MYPVREGGRGGGGRGEGGGGRAVVWDGENFFF